MITSRVTKINMKLTSLFLSLLISTSISAAELAVHAAASLTDAMKEIAVAYEKESGDKLQFNFGASSMLARQIEEGAPADLFFSADEAKMDALEKKALLLPGTRHSLLSNSLVIVVAAKEKVVPTENVRAALAAVESGNVDAGIIYKTDSLISKKVKIAVEIPAAEGPKISYPVAVLKSSKEPERTRKFAEYLAGPKARAIFAKFGFIVTK